MPFAAQGWNYSQSTGYCWFNALEAQFQKALLCRGLQTLAAFTWEKCLGDSNGDYNAENGSAGARLIEYFFNAHLYPMDRARFNIPKVFNWSTVYELPFGKNQRWMNHGWMARAFGNWETNYSFLARSGQNFNPTWGGASNICSLAHDDRLRADYYRRRRSDQYRSGELVERRGFHHRLQQAESSFRLPVDPARSKRCRTGSTRPASSALPR